MLTVGIIGAGQLGRMLALAGAPLGIETLFVDPAEAPSARGFGEHIRADFDDKAALDELAMRCDVVTFEFENVPVAGIEALADRVAVWPPPQALAVAQSRRLEKACFERVGIPVSPWRTVDSADELAGALDELTLPLVVKTDRFGYDGKGQKIVRDREDPAALFDEMGSVALLAEQLVAFDYEVSIIGSRGTGGEIVSWPLTLNEHRNGILHQSRALPSGHRLEAAAEALFRSLVESLDYVGTLAIELFVVGNELLGNEFAPRVHNSGHWTIDGAVTSQFENHLRAIAGWPLGDTLAPSACAMRNFIGTLPERTALLAVPGLALHDYVKTPRPGRKVGHANVVATDDAQLERRLDYLDRVTAPR